MFNVLRQTRCLCSLRNIRFCRSYVDFQRISPRKCQIGINYKSFRYIGNLSKEFIRSTKGKTWERLMKQYNVGKDFKLVYINDFHKYILLIQGAAIFFTVLPAFALLKYHFSEGPLQAQPVVFFETKLQSGIACCFSVFLIIGTFLVLKRYPTRIYFNEKTNEFKILSHSIVPMRTKFFECSAGSGKELYNDGSLTRTLVQGNSVINGKKFIIFEHYFSYPMYFNKLYGHELCNL